MVRRWKKVTLWITNTDVSVKKTAKLIKKTLPTLKVLTFDDTEEQLLACDVLVSTVHRFVLSHSRFRRDKDLAIQFAKRIGCVIYDEIHTLGGPTFGNVFDLFAPCKQLGLSATPTRKDKANLKYMLSVGPCFEMEGIDPPKFPTIAKAIHYYNEPDPSFREWKYSDEAKKNLNISATIHNITADPKRKPLLLKILAESLRRGQDTLDNDVTLGIGESIIIFCGYLDEIDNIMHLISTVDESNLPPEDKLLFKDIKVCTVTGKTPPLGVADAVSNARIIITNYQKLGTAFSEARFTTAVLWSSTKSYAEQAVGRIGRYCEEQQEWNKRLRYVYDIVDGGGTLAQVQFKNHRSELYKKLGFTTQHVKWDIETERFTQ